MMSKVRILGSKGACKVDAGFNDDDRGKHLYPSELFQTVI